MIKNNPTINDPDIVNLRNFIEHRASWMALLLDEAKKEGADPEKVGRSAVFRMGQIHGQKFKDAKNMKEFAEKFLPDHIRKVFEMEIVNLTDETLEVHFGYCPLVAAWQKLGLSDETIELYCDIAMDGDRGISSVNGMELTLDGTIAQGKDKCIAIFKKVK